jgi:hypothetical protein
MSNDRRNDDGTMAVVTDLARRAIRFWPVGLAVAVVTAVIGLALTWETPRLYVSRATVYPPAGVTNASAGQRYAADLNAAVQSSTVRSDAAESSDVPVSALGETVVRRLRQSSVMQAEMTTSERLADAGRVLDELVTRAGQSLAAPDVAAADAQRARAEEALAQAEDAAVDAQGVRDSFVRDRDGVRPADELAILGPQLAQLRLCATGAIVPPGSEQATCESQLADLEAQAEELAQAADVLAAFDRDVERAEAGVAVAQEQLDDIEAAVVRAGAGPVIEVTHDGEEVSQVGDVARRWLAVVLGAMLLGAMLIVALALLSDPARQQRRDDHTADGDRSERIRS